VLIKKKARVAQALRHPPAFAAPAPGQTATPRPFKARAASYGDPRCSSRSSTASSFPDRADLPCHQPSSTRTAKARSTASWPTSRTPVPTSSRARSARRWWRR
jgi:hypothetical protein